MGLDPGVESVTKDFFGGFFLNFFGEVSTEVVKNEGGSGQGSESGGRARRRPARPSSRKESTGRHPLFPEWRFRTELAFRSCPPCAGVGSELPEALGRICQPGGDR